MSEKGSITVTFEKGLNEFVEPSRLQPGFATILRNFIPEADGSLRIRVAWNRVASTYDGSPPEPADKKVRGMAHHPKHKHMPADTVFVPALVVFNAETSGNPGYRLYHTPLEHLDDPGHKWRSAEFIGGAGWNNDNPVATVVAGGHLLYCTDDFARIRAWKGDGGATAPFDIPNSRVGRTMTYYKNRIFTAGGKETADPAGLPEDVNTYSTQPYRMWFSGLLGQDLATDTIWDTTDLDNPAGFLDIGKDDGQAIETIVQFDQGILVGKSESLYYVVGTSPATFQLVPLDAGECAPGRAIVVTPYGAVVCGKTEAYIYKGNIPEPIDTPVSESYVLTGGYLTVSYVDGMVHVIDAARDTSCVYDLEGDAWHIETVGFDPGFGFAFQEKLMLGPWDSSTQPLAYYRQIPDGFRGIDEGLGLLLHAKTPEMWLGGVASPVTIRHCWLRYRQRAGDSADAALTVNSIQNGNIISTTTIEPEDNPGVYRKRLDFKGTTYSAQFEFLQVATQNDDAVFDIEEIEIGLDTERKR